MKKKLRPHAGQRVRIRDGLHDGTPGTIEYITADGKIWVSHESCLLRPDGPQGTVTLPYALEELEPLLRLV